MSVRVLTRLEYEVKMDELKKYVEQNELELRADIKSLRGDYERMKRLYTDKNIENIELKNQMKRLRSEKYRLLDVNRRKDSHIQKVNAELKTIQFELKKSQNLLRVRETNGVAMGVGYGRNAWPGTIAPVCRSQSDQAHSKADEKVSETYRRRPIDLSDEEDLSSDESLKVKIKVKQKDNTSNKNEYFNECKTSDPKANVNDFGLNKLKLNDTTVASSGILNKASEKKYEFHLDAMRKHHAHKEEELKEEIKRLTDYIKEKRFIQESKYKEEHCHTVIQLRHDNEKLLGHNKRLLHCLNELKQVANEYECKFEETLKIMKEMEIIFNDSNCIVCCERQVDCALYECGHSCMCYDCAIELQQGTALCPICRADVRDILRIYK